MREKGRHSLSLWEGGTWHRGGVCGPAAYTVLGVDVATWSPMLISLQKLPLNRLSGVTTVTKAY